MNTDNTSSTMESGESSMDLYTVPESASVTQNKGERDGSTPPESQGTNQTKPNNTENKQADNAPASQADNKDKANQNQPEKKPFVPRSEQRKREIEESLAEVKKAREELSREREELSRIRNNNVNKDGKNEPQEAIFIDKPATPELSREELQKMFNDAVSTKNAAAQAAIQAEWNKWDKYDTDLKFWKLENGKEIEKFTTSKKENWAKATKQFPELSNSESPLFKECVRLAKLFPEVYNRKSADGEYLIAQLAGMRTRAASHASEVGALKDQVQKLTDQLNASQKKLQPANQGSKPNISSAGKTGSADERLEARLSAA